MTLQSTNTPSELKSHPGRHPQTHDNGCFSDTIPVARYSREGHANHAIRFVELGDDIGPQRLRSMVEQYEPVSIGGFELSDSARHLEIQS